MASDSRGVKHDVQQLAWSFGVLQSLGDNSQCQRLNSCDGVSTVSAISHGPCQFGNLGEPSTVLFPFDFDFKNHGEQSSTGK